MRRLWEEKGGNADRMELLKTLKSKVPGSYIVGATKTNLGTSSSLRVLSDGRSGGGEEVPFQSEVLVADLFTQTGKAGDLLMWEDWYKKLKKHLPPHEVRGKLHGQRLKIYFTGVKESDASMTEPMRGLRESEMRELIDRKMGDVTPIEEVVVARGVSRRAALAFRKVLYERVEWLDDESSRMDRKSGTFGLPDGDRKEIAKLMRKAMESLEEAGILLDAHIEDLGK